MVRSFEAVEVDDVWAFDPCRGRWVPQREVPEGPAWAFTAVVWVRGFASVAKPIPDEIPWGALGDPAWIDLGVIFGRAYVGAGRGRAIGPIAKRGRGPAPRIGIDGAALP